jgi:glycosyltransferase involved in cell wall biosynthesis
VRFRFLTSTPLDVRRGSGTFVGIYVLARALEALGHTVKFETPRRSLPIYTAQRLLFNRSLRPSSEFDLTVGFDMDGYRIAAGCPSHVASLKGVIADEVRFESGLTHLTMSMQARRERLHVHRAALVLVTSRYSGDRAQEFYGLSTAPRVVPELIDLAEWRRLLGTNTPAGGSGFTVLYAGRLYRRKRVDVLLRAAAVLRDRIPGLEVRIVGDGPCAPALHRLSGSLNLAGTVCWLGHVPLAQLVAEYQRADVFCLPSVQEGFGIVLLEAMAAERPIVAARAGAIPEVAPHGLLVDADSPEALAAGIESLCRSPEMRDSLARAGVRWVEQFDAPRVARLFLDATCPSS